MQEQIQFQNLQDFLDGEKLKQSDANQLSLNKNIIILCGHYKGIDQRIRDYLITKEISIGDV